MLKQQQGHLCGQYTSSLLDKIQYKDAQKVVKRAYTHTDSRVHGESLAFVLVLQA